MDAMKQQDAIMTGVARAVEKSKKITANWQEAVMKGNLKQAWAMMPPEMKEQLKQQDPAGYERVVSMLGGA